MSPKEMGLKEVETTKHFQFIQDTSPQQLG
jgi:hypothetical protein